MSDQNASGVVPALRLDRRTTRRGRTVVGGRPVRVLSLAQDGIDVFDRLAEGERPWSVASARLARRLLGGGLAHPRPDAGGPAVSDVAVVVPVRDDPYGLETLLSSDALDDVAEVVVVDDGSSSAASEEIATAHGRQVVRNIIAGGPGAARNRGVHSTGAPMVAFVDADCLPPSRWLEPLLAHFADPNVVAVAPRIAGVVGTPAHWLAAAETDCGPLDRGEDPGRVAHGAVPFVPAATLLVRRSTLEAIGGFDESTWVGEDVDLVWRLGGAGTVRYEPAVVCAHRPRSTIVGWIGQRVAYGTSAAELARRHPGRLAPVDLNVWTLVAWSFVGLGGRRARLVGLAIGIGSTGALVTRLWGRVDAPVATSLQVAGRGHLGAGRWLATALRRVWWPGLVLGGSVSSRVRWLTAVVMVGIPVVDAIRRQPQVGVARGAAAQVADDLAYGTGVWLGSIRARSVAALRPRIRGRRLTRRLVDGRS